MRKGFVEQYGKLADHDRSFDIAFWLSQPAKARFDAAWELIVHASKVKGIDPSALRMQRSVEAYRRQPTPQFPASPR
jgi:hypothetical protein